MPDPSYGPKTYRKQGGDEFVVASGGAITIEAGGALSGLTQTQPLGTYLLTARQLASGETLSTGANAIITSSADNPQLALTSSGDQSLYLNWASAQVAGIKLAPIALSAATASGIALELYGESVGTATAADAVAAFDIRVWSGVGDTEMGSTHPNFSSTPSWQGITVASGDIVAGAPLNVTLIPQAHAARAIRLYDMRARYVRSS